MIKGGTGGAKTQTGLKFEKRVDLRTAFSKLPNYQVIGNELLYCGEPLAKFYKKYELYNDFLKELGINWEKIISKKWLPDESIFVMRNKTLFIIEIKFQNVPGSVDEKLQTCDFKKRIYQKMLAPKSIKVEYIYVLNDWFKQSEYKDTLDYIQSVNCHYFFKELPLSALGLPGPK